MKTVLILILVSIGAFTLLSFRNREKQAVISWYGHNHQGKLTASGETFNMNAYTCAHKTLKFGTKVRITNPSNGYSVIVTVNDRGPFVKTREFDLSRQAFRELAPLQRGTIKITYKILK